LHTGALVEEALDEAATIGVEVLTSGEDVVEGDVFLEVVWLSAVVLTLVVVVLLVFGDEDEPSGQKVIKRLA
jgi:hypothetical protein